MRDSDVRAAVLSELGVRFDRDANTRIVEEMGIWSGSVRIDIAVINGELHGYEIKSARDTLARLPSQAELYSQVFDRVTLVVAGKHAPSARAVVPRWWGMTDAVLGRDGVVTLREKRRARLNPRVDALQMARLLWRPEALVLLERHGLDKGVRSKSVETLARRLAESLPLHLLAEEVRSVLKAREDWLGEPVGN